MRDIIKYMKIQKIIMVFFIFILVSALFAETESVEGSDIYLVIDKSLSMENSIGGVLEYINNSIIDSRLAPGDHITVIVFYGQAETLVSETIASEADIARVKGIINRIIADGRFTDIGNSLDSLIKAVEIRPENKQKYMLLITDGIQEAPTTSKYYSPDGSFNHALLENTQIIQKEGWKIHILGIGETHAAKELAEELSGVYSAVPEEASKEEITEALKELFGAVNFNPLPNFSPVNRKGETILTFGAESSGYSTERNVIITGLRLSINGRTLSLIAEPYSFNIAPESILQVSIPVIVPDISEPIQATLTFSFAGDTPIMPAVTNIFLEPAKQFPLSYILIIIIILAVLIAGIILILTKKQKGFNKALVFILEIKDGLPQKRTMSFSDSTSLYLDNVSTGLAFSLKRSGKTFARIYKSGNNLSIKIDDKSDIKAGILPENISGETLAFNKSDSSIIRLVITPK